MLVESVRNYAAMSSAGASLIFSVVMRKIYRRERFNLGLATGNTMITLYEELAEKFNAAKADLSLLSTWNLDEYSIDDHTATPFLPASYLWRHPDCHLVYTADKISF